MSSNNNPLTVSGKNLTDSIKNIITDENVLMQLANNNNNQLFAVKNYDPDTITGINAGLNYVLQSIPLKTGCCMRKQNDNTAKTVKVRVPLQAGALGQLKEFGFEWKNITIPAGKCPANLYNGSPDCDTFYDVYCENVNTVFTEQIGQQVNDTSNKYPIYAPDCACYAPLAIGQESYPGGIPAACYKTGCAVDGSPSYPDPTSRNQPCNATICSSVVDTANLRVGGEANINPTIVQECGASAVKKTVNIESSNNNQSGATNGSTGLAGLMGVAGLVGPTGSTGPTTEATKTSGAGLIILIICCCCCLLSIFLIYYIFIRKKSKIV